MTLSRLLLLSTYAVAGLSAVGSAKAEEMAGHALVLREALYEKAHASVDLACDPALLDMIRALPDMVDLHDCPALAYLHRCIALGDCCVPASIVVRAVEELNMLLDSSVSRSVLSTKQLYELSRSLAALGLGLNFLNSNAAQTTNIAAQNSMVAGGTQTANIGVLNAGSTQPSTVNIGTSAGGTGAATVNIGNANAGSSVNIVSPAISFGANACATATTTTTNIAPQNSNTVNGEQVVNIGVGQNIASGNACNSTQGVTLNAVNNVATTTDLYTTNLGLQSSTAAGAQLINLGVGQAGATAGVTFNAANNNAATTSPYVTTIGAQNALVGGGTQAVNIGNNAGVALLSGTTVNVGVNSSLNAAGTEMVNIGNNAALAVASTSTVSIGVNSSTAAGATVVNIANGASASGSQAVSIGSASLAANTVTIEGGTAATAIQIGNGGTVHGIQIGTGAAANQVKLGSLTAGAVTTVQGGTGIGTGDLVLDTAAAGIINIGNSNVAHTINVGAGTMANTIHIGDNDTPANAIDIGGTASTVTVSGIFRQPLDGIPSTPQRFLIFSGAATTNSTTAIGTQYPTGVAYTAGGVGVSNVAFPAGNAFAAPGDYHVVATSDTAALYAAITAQAAGTFSVTLYDAAGAPANGNYSWIAYGVRVAA